MLHQRPQHDSRWRRDGNRPRWRLLCGGLSLAGPRFSLPLRAFCLIAAGVLVIAMSRHSVAQVPESNVDLFTSSGQFLSPQQARLTLQTLVDMAIAKSPHEYKGKKNWEKTKRVWAGVRFRRDKFRISTKRRWRELRHGQQTRYRISFPGDGSSPPPVIAHVRSVTFAEGDEDQHSGWVIDFDLTTPLDFSARIERWNLGVQWYSVEVSGHMKVRLQLQARLSAYPDYSDIPPAIVIDPVVTSASLTLQSLHVDRVSKIGGEVAEQWGDVAKKIIKEILIDDINSKLHTKLNNAIDKKRDALRFSASDWVNSIR